MKPMLLILLVVGLTSCKKEEEPTFPPEIVGAQVTCGDVSSEDSPVVEELGVEITASREPYRYVPLEVSAATTSWNPPLVCRGIFQFIVQVRDAEGHQVKQTLEVDKSS